MELIAFITMIFALFTPAIIFWRNLLKWKRELVEWQTEKDKGLYMVYSKQVELESWQRDLEHRERVWKDFKQKVEKDLKWNWKI